MNGFQNKKFTLRKLFVVHVSGLCHQKTLMRQLVTFGELSNDVDTTEEVQ
jgi:hypothetical protein